MRGLFFKEVCWLTLHLPRPSIRRLRRINSTCLCTFFAASLSLNNLSSSLFPSFSLLSCSLLLLSSLSSSTSHFLCSSLHSLSLLSLLYSSPLSLWLDILSPSSQTKETKFLMSFGNCNCAKFLDLLVFLFVPLLTLLALEKELYNSDASSILGC